MSSLVPVHNADAALTKSSARKMMESGKSMSCDFRNQDGYGTQDGTIYFSKGKMRGDFTMQQQGMGTFESHMIRDKEWQYTWGGPMGESQGMKMRADAFESQGKKKKGFDTDKEVDMDCREWRENPSVFTPPSNIAFSDTTQAMQQIHQTANQMQQMKCQACDQAPPGEGREQCRRMMGC
jgi:hypothetical protein